MEANPCREANFFGAVTPYSASRIIGRLLRFVLLGMSCNTTLGRSYQISSRTPGVGFRVTTQRGTRRNRSLLELPHRELGTFGWVSSLG